MSLPELPEVENIAEGLRIRDIKVTKPTVVRGAYEGNWRQAGRKLGGGRIVGVTRRGKRLILLTDREFAILVQLGMTGKFMLAEPAKRLEKHAHFLVNFNGGKQLRFVDARRFGRVWFIDGLDEADPDAGMEAAGMSRLGPEPGEIGTGQFRQILDSKRVIKNLLLDQTRIAGLGNIYADESLFAAGIHPAVGAGEVSEGQGRKLRTAIRSILRRAIAYGGTTFSDFRNAYGDMGRFKKHLKVYQRTGQGCKRCGALIERMVISGRGSHYCPKCQQK